MAKEDATAVNDQVVADTTATDSAPVEEQNLEVVSDGPELNPNDYHKAETETEGEESEPDKTDGDSKPEETDTEAPQGEKPLSPKSENRFQQLANQKREYEQQLNDPQYLQTRLAELNAQKAQVAQEQELLNEVNPETGEYYTPQEAERIAFQQSREAKAQQLENQGYALQVQQNQQVLSREADKVAEDYPELVDPTNENYDPEVAAEYDAVLGQNLIYQLPDGRQFPAATLLANGINPAVQATLIGSNISPLQIAKLTAEPARKAAAKGTTIGQVNAQKATEKMLANADAPTSNRTGSSARDTENMTADEYAKAHNMKPVW